jgi:hypothetical protein
MPSSASVLHHAQHLAHQFGVQRAGDLVAQQHGRLHGQRARNGHALLLAARELIGPGVELLGQAHALQQLAGRASARGSVFFTSVGASMMLRPTSGAGTG